MLIKKLAEPLLCLILPGIFFIIFISILLGINLDYYPSLFILYIINLAVIIFFYIKLNFKRTLFLTLGFILTTVICFIYETLMESWTWKYIITLSSSFTYSIPFAIITPVMAKIINVYKSR